MGRSCLKGTEKSGLGEKGVGNSNGNSKRMRDNKREKLKPEFERLAWFREENRKKTMLK